MEPPRRRRSPPRGCSRHGYAFRGPARRRAGREASLNHASWARREELAPGTLLAGTSVGAVRGHQQRMEPPYTLAEAHSTTELADLMRGAMPLTPRADSSRRRLSSIPTALGALVTGLALLLLARLAFAGRVHTSGLVLLPGHGRASCPPR